MDENRRNDDALFAALNRAKKKKRRKRWFTALAIIAVMIPVLAWATQVANIKLMPQQSPAGAEEAGTMAGCTSTP